MDPDQTAPIGALFLKNSADEVVAIGALRASSVMTKTPTNPW